MKTQDKLNYKNLRLNPREALDLVCFSHLHWDFVYQRPQHLLTRAVKEFRVFYIEEPRIDKGPARMAVKQDDSGVLVASPYLPDSLDKTASRNAHIELIDQFLKDQAINRYMIWYYTPMAVGYTSHLKPELVIYDCMDELSAFKNPPRLMKDYEIELLRMADVVFTGGQSLYEAKQSRHTNIHLFPSSIEREHFAQARTISQDTIDQMDIPHPRLGFFGVIDERMDINLLETIAQKRPDWHLVMVGPTAKIDQKDLPRSANIHYLGNKPYRDLPAYLAGWDIALLPFALNESTRFISPTKTPEYLAGGKPVVSTPITDVIRPYGDNGLVSIANNPDEFIQACEAYLNQEGGWEDWLERVDDHLSTNSWDITWEQMSNQIKNALDKRKQILGNENGRVSEAEAASLYPPVVQSQDIVGSGLKINGGKDRSVGYDYLIVGAGFAGSVMAERLARGSGNKVLLIDKRPHIGGNAFDVYNNEGILIHQYGPHIFHTNSRDVFTYLSRFTEWRQYEHRVLASVDGLLVPMPINLDTINQLYGLSLTAHELEGFYTSVAEVREKILTSEDVVVSKVGRELYEKFFRNYTRKQWDLDPSELDASVTSRVPIRMNRDDRYFTDTYQAMPVHGYTRMFERMLDHPRIHIMLNTDYHDILDVIPFREMIYTGPVDEYFDFSFGKLPYRSLDFKFETLNKSIHQPAAVINYPNEHLYTRSTEFKYLTGQEHPKTTLVYEFPQAEGDPYYPIPRPENAELYKKYQKLADKTSRVHFVGRLATYKYYNMDQVTAQALTLYTKLAGVKRSETADEHTAYYVPAAVPKARS